MCRLDREKSYDQYPVSPHLTGVTEIPVLFCCRWLSFSVYIQGNQRSPSGCAVFVMDSNACYGKNINGHILRTNQKNGDRRSGFQLMNPNRSDINQYSHFWRACFGVTIIRNSPSSRRESLPGTASVPSRFTLMKGSVPSGVPPSSGCSLLSMALKR